MGIPVIGRAEGSPSKQQIIYRAQNYNESWEILSPPPDIKVSLDPWGSRVRRISVYPRTLSCSVRFEWEFSTPPEEILEVVVNAALRRGDGYERGGN
jgi:hypothetical protein